MKTFKYKRDTIYLAVGAYANNGRLYVEANTKKELFSDITVNLPGEYGCLLCDENEAFLNADLPDDFVDRLKELGIIRYSYGKVRCNLGYYEHVSFDPVVLKEYDSGLLNDYISLDDLIDKCMRI